MTTERNQILSRLKKSKEYREAFVAEHINTAVPLQIRAIREALPLTQKQLGQKVGMAQERISVMEDPDYAKFTLKTLLRLANAFDVALIVRFAPFSELLNWTVSLAPRHIDPATFAHDRGLAVYDLEECSVGIEDSEQVGVQTVHKTDIDIYDVGVTPGSKVMTKKWGTLSELSIPTASISSLGRQTLQTTNLMYS